MGLFERNGIRRVRTEGDADMSDADRPILDPLVLDLVEWVAAAPRSYDEVMGAWRTSCPRLPVWEEAVDRGFLTRTPGGGGRARVLATVAGVAFLHRHERRVAAPALRA
jgi:hypothetical protein